MLVHTWSYSGTRATDQGKGRSGTNYLDWRRFCLTLQRYLTIRSFQNSKWLILKSLIFLPQEINHRKVLTVYHPIAL